MNSLNFDPKSEQGAAIVTAANHDLLMVCEAVIQWAQIQANSGQDVFILDFVQKAVKTYDSMESEYAIRTNLCTENYDEIHMLKHV